MPSDPSAGEASDPGERLPGSGRLDRGLRIDQGLLIVIDGSKGLRKAVQEVLGAQAQVQRCTWHKREDVVSYLPRGQQELWRRKLQRAYEQPTYEAAQATLGAAASGTAPPERERGAQFGGRPRGDAHAAPA